MIPKGESLQTSGETVAALNDLKTIVEQAENILNFPQDYGATAKYQALANEAERQQAAGELEEGGWE